MNCSKCQKPIVKYLTCSTCQCKLCSNVCLTEHMLVIHNEKRDSKQNTVKRRSVIKSPFLKMGEFLKIINVDPHYDFKNFEYVKAGKKPQVLGAGAYGDVYLSKNKLDGKYYAIKHMSKSKIREQGASLDIVEREINIHSRLVHENIIRMYSHYEDKEGYYIVMDYASGQTLFNMIKKKNGMSEKLAFKYFIQSAAAVSFLHDHNLVHRDLKPENLLIDENDTVKLCDFGWCVELSEGNRKTFCGTYEYMAPQIINEEPYDASIDTWALGILLYELTHGYSPFRAKLTKNTEKEYEEIFRNILKYSFKIEKNMSENCSEMIKKLLNPDNKNPIKVKEIFAHPWVLGFEQEYKEQKLKELSAKEKTLLESNPINEQVIEDKKNINIVNQSPVPIIKKKDSGNKIGFNLFEKSKEISNNSKKDLIKPNIPKPEIVANKEDNDFELIRDEKKDLLFESVLNQVKEKNMTKKRKKNKEISPDNKIYLKAEKPITIEKKEDDQNDNKIQLIQNEIIDEVEPEIRFKSKKGKIEENIDKLDISQEDNRKRIELEKKLEKKRQQEREKEMLREIEIEKAKKREKEKEIEIEKEKEKQRKLKEAQNEIDLKKEKEMKENERLERIEKNLKKNKNKIEEDEKLKQLEKEKEDMKELKNEISQKIFYKGKDKENDSKKKEKDEFKLIEDNEKYNFYIGAEMKKKKEQEMKKNKNKNDRPKHNDYHNFEINPDRKKNLDKELDLGFLPKDLLYNDKTYDDSKNNLLAAIDILEKANENKNQVQKPEEKVEPNNFWSFLNPFKCGYN